MITLLNIIVKNIYNFFDILFPISCIVCGDHGTDLCQLCIEKMQWPKRSHTHWITSLFNYRDLPATTIIYHIKKYPNQRLAILLAELFSQRILNRPSDQHNWIIIPIPISSTRFYERGFNQSLIIGQALGQVFSFSVDSNILIKNKHTQKQGTSISKEARLTNVLDSFSVLHPQEIIGKNVILVDDVTTTGATISEARNTLLDAGCLKVFAWTIAN